MKVTWLILTVVFLLGLWGCNSAPTAPMQSSTPGAEESAEPKASPIVTKPLPGPIPAVGTKSPLGNDEWRERLSAEQYRVLREEGTERSFTGEYWNHKGEGVYHCAACGAPLFASKDKYKSGTGWPSYTRPIEKGRIGEKPDGSMGAMRTEVHCDHCGGHLGHLFPDGPKPTGHRYCINSVSLVFQDAKQNNTSPEPKKP